MVRRVSITPCPLIKINCALSSIVAKLRVCDLPIKIRKMYLFAELNKCYSFLIIILNHNGIIKYVVQYTIIVCVGFFNDGLLEVKRIDRVKHNTY